MEAPQFFKRELVVAELFSIPVKIDYRWFPVWVLMSWLIAVSLPDGVANGFAWKVVLGGITALLFFACVFVHELGHAFIARSEGIEVTDIVLHPFGGIARLRREPSTPGADFRVAIAGPGASFIVSAVFFGLWAVSSRAGTDLLTPLFFILFLLNFLLAIFNLFPGYPLDGGRVLRAYLWKKGADLTEATILAGNFGRIIAGALVIVGIGVAVVRRELFTGIWTVVVGLFLYDSASSILKSVRNFEGLTVANVTELAVSLKPEMTITEMVDEVIPNHRKVVFPVVEEGRLQGFLLLKDVKDKIPTEKWRETRLGSVMRPVEEDYFIEADAPVSDAKELLKNNGIDAVAVLDRNGRFAGVVERGKIRRRV